MASKSKAAAEGIENLIKSLTADFEVISSTAPSFDLERVTDRKCYVWCSDRESTIQSRAIQAVIYSVSVAIVERVGSDDHKIEDCLETLEFIGDSLIARQYTACYGNKNLTCDVIEYEHAPLYDRELLETRRIFGGGIILRIQVAEPLLKDLEV
jgi:hypothetical protein